MSIATISYRGNSWKAGINEDYRGLTLKQLQDKLGISNPNKEIDVQELINFLKDAHSAKNSAAPKAAFKRADWLASIGATGFHVDASNPIFQHWHKPPEDLSDAELPKHWNWKDIGGVTFVNEAINQV